jgi:hypothetical protein
MEARNGKDGNGCANGIFDCSGDGRNRRVWVGRRHFDASGGSRLCSQSDTLRLENSRLRWDVELWGRLQRSAAQLMTMDG